MYWRTVSCCSNISHASHGMIDFERSCCRWASSLDPHSFVRSLSRSSHSYDTQYRNASVLIVANHANFEAVDRTSAAASWSSERKRTLHRLSLAKRVQGERKWRTMVWFVAAVRDLTCTPSAAPGAFLFCLSSNDVNGFASSGMVQRHIAARN